MWSKGHIETGIENAPIHHSQALAQSGVTLMTVGCDGPDCDLRPAQALIRWWDRRG